MQVGPVNAQNHIRPICGTCIEEKVLIHSLKTKGQIILVIYIHPQCVY